MIEETKSGFQANLLRAELLRQQSRYAEAEKYLHAAIAEKPEQAEGYYQMAFCYCDWEGHGQKALEAIDQAIRFDPNESRFLSLRAWILVNLKKYDLALECADQALALNPASIMAINSQARASIGLTRWQQAEGYARRTLALDARNQLAGNILAMALRLQGNVSESESVTASLLSHVPDNAMTQSNAGWSALQLGDHRRANQHFLEALRLNPHDDYARRGLLHSFSSRVWIYRRHYQFVTWLGRHRKGMRYFYLALVYVGYRFIVIELRTHFGEEGVHWGMVVIALYLVVFGFGRSFGNLFLLFDPFARHALTHREKAWSLLAALIFSVLFGALIFAQAWPQAGVLLGIVGLFAWGVISPRLVRSPARQPEG